MKKKTIAVAIAVAVILVLILLIKGMGNGKITEYPYEMDKNNLELGSIFPSSIDNPDNEFTYGEDIATLEIKNTSGKYLEKADITVKLADKRTLHFEVEDLPADMSVWAFETSNESVEIEVEASKVQCDATYGPRSDLMVSEFPFTVDGSKISFENHTGKDLKKVEAKVHCVFDGMYFGGKSYTYLMKKIPNNGSYELDVPECAMGEADVANININKE